MVITAKMQEQYQTRQEEDFVTQQERQPQLIDPQQQKQRSSMKATACLILGRNYLSPRVQQLNQAIAAAADSGKDQNLIISRMYAKFLMQCYMRNQFNQPQNYQKVFNARTIQQLQQFYYMFQGIQALDIINQGPIVKDEQKSFVEFVKQFDKNQEMRKQQQFAQDIQSNQKDVALFGYSIASLSMEVKMLIGVIILSIIIFTFGLAFKMLKDQIDKSSKKKKKQKQKSK